MGEQALGAAVRVEDFETALEVTTPTDLEAALSKRHGAAINSFWLSHGAEEFPAINIMVKGDLAYVHYFPQERHPGFASAAKELVPKPNETSTFFVYPTEKVWVLNSALIPFSDALKVAQEFAVSKAMPRCIQWSEL
jgi:immunity protein Imm1 of predicted polymorphic toxin system